MRSNKLVLSTLLALTAAASAHGEEITFNKHVATILWNNCAGCHRPGEVGPFPLLTYEDAAKRAGFIQEITASRRMPPWRAEADFGEFHGVRRLSDEELGVLAVWAENGAPEGDAADLPPQLQFSEGWQLGEPDLVLKMPEEFHIPAESNDIYRCFVLPIGNTSDRIVSAVEFRPGNRKVVHHGVFYLDNSGQARQKDEAQAGQGYDSFGGPGIVPSGGLGGWVPGATALALPEDLGKFLKRGSDLVLQIHYHPNGKPETDQSQLGIHFAKRPVKNFVTGIPLINLRLNIPPGERRYRVTAGATIPIDVLAIGIFPHMHLIGREMKVVAKLPDGTEQPMVWIKDWDFNWQDQYRYAQPVKLPKGTRLELEAYYDNSADNPTNPNDPPKGVHWGEQTTDEMCLCTVQICAENVADMGALAKMPGARLGAALGGALPDAGLGNGLLKKLLNGWQVRANDPHELQSVPKQN